MASLERLKLKLTKLEKKLIRKQERAKSILKCDGVEVTTRPTCYLVVTNFGLTTGAAQDDIYAIFSKYGKLQKVVLIPDKQYSFLEYTTVTEAENALSSSQGLEISLPNENTISLLLAYVDKVPDENLVSFNDDLPPGLVLLQDFITEKFEYELLNSLNWDEEKLLSDESKQHLKHRRVQHFGYEFKYDTSTIDKEHPLKRQIPRVCKPLFDKLITQGYLTMQPDQLTVNQYEPGQGIPPHVDTHSSFEDEIVSLSLGSSVVMNFTNSNNGQQKSVFLPRRSVLIMTDQSRYLWMHGIVPRKTDVIRASDGGLTLHYRQSRTSFTFRRVRQSNVCCCSYPEKCDSQEKQSHSNENPNKIEDTFVHQVYDAIAEHFSATRHKPWPKVVDFLRSLTPGSIVLDVGCGNGKYFDANPEIIHLGCDQSNKLLSICYDRHYEVFADDVVNLSVRSECADACICIAVIHHLSTQERRLAAISNLVNSIRQNGLILIYVWALEQDLAVKKSPYIKDSRSQTVQKRNSPIQSNGCSVKTNLPFPVHVNRTHFTHQDILVPWSLKKGREITEETSDVFYRYYHLFQSGELEKLCSLIPNVEIVRNYYDSGNWCIELKRIN